MELRIRVTDLGVCPSDASGFIATLEVADAEELRAQMLRGPDDEADDWPLAKRYGEICDRARSLEASLARALEERDFAKGMLDRVVIQGGAEGWTTREMRDWCCDYKDLKNGYPVDFIQRHDDHANCGHRERDDQEKPADHWTDAKTKVDLARVTAERDELQKFNRDHVVTLECPCCGDEAAAAQFFIEDQETFCGCGGIVAVGGDPEDNAYISLNECINPAHRGEVST